MILLHLFTIVWNTFYIIDSMKIMQLKGRDFFLIYELHKTFSKFNLF
jgi:hypothetical protein